MKNENKLTLNCKTWKTTLKTKKQCSPISRASSSLQGVATPSPPLATAPWTSRQSMKVWADMLVLIYLLSTHTAHRLQVNVVLVSLSKNLSYTLHPLLSLGLLSLECLISDPNLFLMWDLTKRIKSTWKQVTLIIVDLSIKTNMKITFFPYLQLNLKTKWKSYLLHSIFLKSNSISSNKTAETESNLVNSCKPPNSFPTTWISLKTVHRHRKILPVIMTLTMRIPTWWLSLVKTKQTRSRLTTATKEDNGAKSWVVTTRKTICLKVRALQRVKTLWQLTIARASFTRRVRLQTTIKEQVSKTIMLLHHTSWVKGRWTWRKRSRHSTMRLSCCRQVSSKHSRGK